MATTKIWCLLIDHNNELQLDPFRVSVPIDPDFLVDDLKNAIKVKRSPTLNHLSASELSVWRCEDRNFLTDAEDTELEERLAAINFDDETVVKKLTEELVVEDLEIAKNENLIVRIPAPRTKPKPKPKTAIDLQPAIITTTTMATTKIWFLLIDHNNELQLDPFRVSIPIDPDFLVDDLKKAIKAEPTVRYLSEVDLSVWRCEDRNFLTDTEDTELEERLAAIVFDDGTVVEKLAEEFVVEDLEIRKNEILIVRIPAPRTKPKPKPKPKPTPKTAIDYRDANLSVLSKTTMSVTNASDLLEVNQHLWMGAFENYYAHNVAIFHPALAKLQHRVDTLERQIDTGYDWPKNPESETPTRFTTQFLHLAQSYFDQSRAFYATEEALAEKLLSLLDQVLMLKASTEKYSPTTVGKKKGSFTKGQNHLDYSWGPFHHIIAEFKLLFGQKGDASAQGGLRYGKTCHAMKACARLKYSKMPVIILGVMGPVLEISIGVCLEHVVLDTVLHLHLRSSVNDDRTVFKLALIFSALKECSDSLFAECKNSEIVPPGDPATWHLPRPSAVIPSKNSRVGDVKFEGKLDRENVQLATHEGSLEPWEMRPVFLANVEQEEVIVKFTTRYNKDAHNILSALDYAPKLHFTEEVVGGQTMVVMERLKGQPMSASSRESLPPSVFDDIEEAVKVLHAENIVFGDLRDANVIIVKSDAKEKAKLVDFDWPAIEGKGLYPSNVNRFLFDDDVEGFGLMRKKHDWYGLMRLIKEYCNDAKYTTDKCSQLEAMRR